MTQILNSRQPRTSDLHEVAMRRLRHWVVAVVAVLALLLASAVSAA